VSVFELMVNDAKNRPEKFEKFLNKDQKQMIETLNELEEELAEKEEELAKHLSGKNTSEEEGVARNQGSKRLPNGQDPETEEELYQSLVEKSEEENPTSEEKKSVSLEISLKEGFTSNCPKNCPQPIFSTPCAVNTPINEDAIPEAYTGSMPLPTGTGGNYNSYIPLNPTEGNYCLPIQKLQYDGIWNNNVVELGNGYQTNNWSIPARQPIVQSQYCTNKFINIPENVLIPGTKTHSEIVGEKNYIMQCN
jgi:hypothetical protein